MLEDTDNSPSASLFVVRTGVGETEAGHICMPRILWKERLVYISVTSRQCWFVGANEVDEGCAGRCTFDVALL